MKVTIEISGGIGIAYWKQDRIEDETFIGEISSKWLENEAEFYFDKKLGENVSLEVINLDEN